jgi:MraZ protein
LLGTFAAPIDAAGSVVLPAALHHAHTAWVLTRGDDGCLQMLPPAVWRALAERTCTTPAGAGPAPARTLRRQLFASAAPLKPDSSGAIVIPPNLRAYADLGEQALFVGLYTYIEVWSDDRWQAIVENL